MAILYSTAAKIMFPIFLFLKHTHTQPQNPSVTSLLMQLSTRDAAPAGHACNSTQSPLPCSDGHSPPCTSRARQASVAIRGGAGELPWLLLRVPRGSHTRHTDQAAMWPGKKKKKKMKMIREPMLQQQQQQMAKKWKKFQQKWQDQQSRRS